MVDVATLIRGYEIIAQERPFDIRHFCTEPKSGTFFQEQYDFIVDRSKFKLACNSRRSGKTLACAGDLIATALEYREVNVAYITLSRVNAKLILWEDLLRVLRESGIEHKPNHSELSCLLPASGSKIWLFGAKDEAEIEKIRGRAYKLVYVDEAQAFKPYIRRLIFDILSPSLFDYDGRLALIGTPGPVKAGFFYEACHNLPGARGYSRHKWTLFKNPFLQAKSGKTPEQLVKEDLELKGLTESSPWVQREIFGNWCDDSESRVYAFERHRNEWSEASPIPTEFPWFHSLGVDIGFDDPDAIVVWAFHPKSRVIYQVAEERKAKQSIGDLADRIKVYQQKFPNAYKVIDTGALGKKITEELLQRYGINLKPAEKKEKLSYIELMNDDFRTGRVKLMPQSQLADDYALLCWQPDHDPPVEDERYSNDLPDAALYSWRECRRLLPVEAPKPKPKLDPDQEIERYWQRKVDEARKPREWWEKS